MNRFCLFAIVGTFGLCHLSNAQQPREHWTTSRIKGAPTPPSKYAIRPAFPDLKFNKPTSLEEISGNRFLISEIGGSVFTFDKSSNATKTKSEVLKIKNCSLWHVTLHPEFAKNKLMFVCYSKAGTTHVSKFKVDMKTFVADEKSEEVVLTWPAGGHNGGCLAFGKDGMLYISTGDGSGPNPPDGLTAGQDISNLFGCILRIDVNQRDKGKQYSIPKDNPFISHEGARGEIWSYGLRNPWKFGVDQKTGRMFAADNGWETWEMIHEIVRGGNSGWPIMEGRAILRSEVKQGPTPIIPPLKDHHHSEANSVIGGPVYRGSKLKELDGTFVYGDYITGTIWGVTPGENGESEFQTLVDTDLRIIAFAECKDGKLFVVDYDFTGQIYEIVPSGIKDQSRDFPRLLSETGIFESVETLETSPGIVAYDVNVKRWTDGLASKRWVGIPGKGTIDFKTDSANAKYPEGTVFVKHLYIPRRSQAGKDVPVETQILHFENQSWHPYSYFWNNIHEQNAKPEARLIDSKGGNFDVFTSPIEGGGFRSQKWHVSATNECRLCHNAGAGFVLGFQPNQLDRPEFRPKNDERLSQIERLFDERVVSTKPRFEEGNPHRLVDPHDEEYSLNDRARSYLHGNCSSCHHPGGNAIVSFYLKRDMPFNKLQVNKGTGIGTFGMQNAKLVIPGDPFRSVLFYRMMKLGYGRMPYIGSSKVDSKGVALIDQWIRNMPYQKSKLDSGPIQKDSTASKALAKVKSNAHAIVPATDPSIKELLKTTEGALALASSIHSGRAKRIDSNGVYKTPNSDIRGLFETFVPIHLRRKSLGNNPDPQSVLSLKGNALRGKLIFSSDSARCSNCHHPSDPAKSIGPNLSAIREKYKSTREVLDHVLNPDLFIEPKFKTWLVNTDAGVLHTGLRVKQNRLQIVLKTAEGKLITIPKTEIEDMKQSEQSLMPKNMLSDLTAQEAADLIEWFAGKRK